MEFRKVIETRRSVRAYETEPVLNETIRSLQEAVQLAPTGNNRQSFKVLLVRNRELRGRIAKEACHQAFISQAPLIAVVCCPPGDEFNAAIVTDHLVLAAQDAGLGSCWVGWFEKDVVGTILPIPEGMVPCILVPMGTAAENPVMRPRKKIEELTEILD